MTTGDKRGAAPKGTSKPRRLGARSANNRYVELRAGRELSPEKDALLKLTARLLTHGINVSNGLFHTTEARDDGEPRALLRELRELSLMIASNLSEIFPDSDAGGELLGRLRG